MNLQPRHIVYVSHYFEPYGLIGAKRSTYFVRYLLSRGLRVTVVKADDRYYGDDLMQPADIKYDLLNVSIAGSKNTYVQYEDKKWKTAYWRALDGLFGSDQVDLVIFSGGPFAYFTLGADLKKKYGVEYILDFRDPWYLDPRLGGNISLSKGRTSLRMLISKLIIKDRESRSVRHAKSVINVSPSLTRLYTGHYAKEDPGKFITILNGFDEEKLGGFVPQKTALEKNGDGPIKIGIFGKFGYYSDSSVDLLLSGVRNLIGMGVRIKLCYCGEDNNGFTNRKHSDLSDIIEINSNLEYIAGMELMSEMDCLILNHRDMVSRGTKIYDYIFLNKPIVAFVDPESELAQFVSRFTNGFVVQSEKEFIMAINSIKRNSLLVLSETLVAQEYSRLSSARDLFECIDTQ